MGTITFRATVAVPATTTADATTGDWLDIPEWAPDIDYIPTGALAANQDWVQFTEATDAPETSTSNTLFNATGMGKYTARKVVINNLAIGQYEKVTLCYREAGALVRT